MNLRKLAKLRRELDSLRRRIATIKGRELESIATQLGRRLDTQRGKEPYWVSDELPHRNPIGILRHGSKDFKPKTAKNIIYQFELDLDALEKKYRNE
jgi:hypothetical protein